jgi:hypothetical protein
VFHLHPDEALNNLIEVLYGYLQENPSRGKKILHFLLEQSIEPSPVSCSVVPVGPALVERSTEQTSLFQ